MTGPNSPRTPLHAQIHAYLLELLQSREWPAYEPLPTESELAAQFHVSRFTAKKALNDLVDKGLIYRVQGKGSFIARAAPDPDEADRQPVSKPEGIDRKKIAAVIMPCLQDGLSANLLAGAERHLSANGYHAVFRSSGNQQRLEKQILRECAESGIGGIIIFPVDGENYNEEILRLTLNHYPVVVVDRYLRGVDTHCVSSDNEGGAYDATSHLIGLGHRRIVYFGVDSLIATSLADRLTGYEKAMAEHRIPLDYHRSVCEVKEEHLKEDLDHGDPSAAYRRVIRSFLENNPDTTAIFAANAYLGVAVMEVAREMGIQVPKQLSVIFFDDYAHSALSAVPPSCIVQPELQIGVESARMLLSIIGNPRQDRRKLTLPTQLIARNSTAPVRQAAALFPLSPKEDAARDGSESAE